MIEFLGWTALFVWICFSLYSAVGVFLECRRLHVGLFASVIFGMVSFVLWPLLLLAEMIGNRPN